MKLRGLVILSSFLLSTSLVEFTVAFEHENSFNLYIRKERNDEAAKQRVLVKYANEKKENVIKNLNSSDGDIYYQMNDLNLLVLDVPAPKMHTLKSLNDEDILFIEEDPVVNLIETIIDVKSNKNKEDQFLEQIQPYGIGMVKADQVSQTGIGIKVCVIDSGIDNHHEDLKFVGGVTGEGSGNWGSDTCERTTPIVGTIAAQDNNIGVVGVAPGASIHIVKVFDGPDRDHCPYIYGSDVLHAGRRCVAAGANIITMNLGNFGYSAILNTGWEKILHDDNVLPIAGAGNYRSTEYVYPASYDSVFSVAAVDSKGGRALFSQHNDQVDVAAPGVAILSTEPGNGYNYFNGTSMAAAHVVGVAALVWEAHRSFSAVEVRQQLRATATDLGDPGRDDNYGYGLVNALAATTLLPSVSSVEIRKGIRASVRNLGDPGDNGAYTQLTPSTPVSITEPTRGMMQIFWLPTVSGNIITCTISNGNFYYAALYTQIDSPPALDSYKCFSDLEYSDGSCEYGPAAERDEYLFVGVYAYAPLENVVLQCDVTSCNCFPDQTCENDVCICPVPTPVCGTGIPELVPDTQIILDEPEETMRLFWLSISPGDSVTCYIQDPHDHFDLYIRVNEPPTLQEYDCGEWWKCEYGPAADGEEYLFVGVYTRNEEYTVPLKCVVETCTDPTSPICGITELTPSRPIGLYQEHSGILDRFWLPIKVGDRVICTITFDPWCSQGNADLYLRVNEVATLSDYDCMSNNPSLANETCEVGPFVTGDEILFVSVYAASWYEYPELQCDVICVPDGTCTPNSGSNCGEDAPGTDSCGNECFLDLDVCPDGQSCVNNYCWDDTSRNLEFITVENVGSEWVRVPLSPGFNKIVPVCTVQYPRVPLVVRMKNLRRKFFDIKLQSPSNASFNIQDVHCVVTEEGEYTLLNGKRLVARRFSSRYTAYKGNWVLPMLRPRKRPDLTKFDTPVVFGQVITYKDERWSTFFTTGNRRQDIPSNANGFRVGKHVGEDTDTERINEKMGYIVVEAQHDTIAGIELEVGITEDIIKGFEIGITYPTPFFSVFDDKPQTLVLTQNGVDGDDGGWAVSYGARTTSSFNAAIFEDQIGDTEINHTTEQVAYIAFGPGNGLLPLIPVVA